MAKQIVFFNKNKLDISNPNAVLTASQGNDYIDLVRNRSNLNGWITTGSVDADATNIIIDFSELRSISEIILIKHNFKSFNIRYWDEVSAYVDFSTPINETTNSAETNGYSFDEVQTSKIKIIIFGTTISDSDKYLAQLIATSTIGRLTGFPVIRGSTIDKNRTSTSMLSGKKSVISNIGGFTCDLAIPYWNIIADLQIVESIYDATEGFLVWICGGDEAQFLTQIKGYRLEDLFLMKCQNEYNPDFVKGVYINGLDLKIKLVEVVD